MVDVAVVGAGIAGCAAAIAMVSLPNAANVTVFEARARSSWIDPDDPRLFELWPNGLRALSSIGVTGLPGKPLERYDFRSRHGQLLASLPTGSIARQQQQSTVVIGAHQLRDWIEKAAMRAGAQLEFEKVVSSVGWHDEHIRLSFADGTERSFSLVIGADGAMSRVRELAGFPKRKLREYRLAAVAGLSTASGSTVESGIGFVAHGHDRRLGAWFYPHNRSDGVKSAWILFAPKDQFLDEEGRIEREPEKLKLRCERAVERFGINLQRFVTDSSHLRAHLLADAPNTKHDWVSKRVALIGEAAHPILPDLGQGCALAFEDVALLHRELSHVDLTRIVELAPALERWRDTRHGRVAQIVEQSRAANLFSHIDGGYPDLRDLAIATSAEPFLTHGLERLVDGPD